jgi:hypothetical protein
LLNKSKINIYRREKEMLIIRNNEGEIILELPEKNFPLYIEIENSKPKKKYKLLVTGTKKLLLN